MERQGDKASPRASSRPRFIAEAQPQHHPGTGQTERESHPHADQSPAQYKTAKISYGQTYIKTLDFYASPIKNKTTSLSFALFVLLVHNFLLSLGLQLLTYKLAYYETSMWS